MTKALLTFNSCGRIIVEVEMHQNSFCRRVTPRLTVGRLGEVVGCAAYRGSVTAPDCKRRRAAQKGRKARVDMLL